MGNILWLAVEQDHGTIEGRGEGIHGNGDGISKTKTAMKAVTYG